MDLPEEVLVLARHPVTFGGLTTRDADLKPHVCRVWHWDLTSERVEVYVGAPWHERIEADLADSDRVAFGFASPDSRAYQLKGAATARKPTDEDRTSFAKAKEARIQAISGAIGFPADKLGAFIGDVDLVVSIEVDALFDQRPGPKAGRAMEAVHAS